MGESAGKSETETGVAISGARGVLAPEALKEMRQIAIRQAAHGVADANQHGRRARGDFHGAAGGRVGHGVLHKVVNDGAQQHGIGGELHGGFRTTVKSQAARGGVCAVSSADLLCEFRKGYRLALDRLRALPGAGEGEEPCQDGLQMQSDAEGFLVGVRSAGVREFHREFGHTSQFGDGRAQFVRDIRTEAPLAVERNFKPGEEFVETRCDRHEFARKIAVRKTRGERAGIDARRFVSEVLQRRQAAAQHARHDQGGHGEQRRAAADEQEKQRAQGAIQIAARASEDEDDFCRCAVRRKVVRKVRVEPDAGGSTGLSVRQRKIPKQWRSLRAATLREIVRSQRTGTTKRRAVRLPNLVKVRPVRRDEAVQHFIHELHLDFPAFLLNEGGDGLRFGEQRGVELICQAAARQQKHRRTRRGEHGDNRQQQPAGESGAESAHETESS